MYFGGFLKQKIMKLSKLDKTSIVVIVWFVFAVTSSLTTRWLVKNDYIVLTTETKQFNGPNALGFIFGVAFISFMIIAIARIVHIWEDKQY